MLIGTLAGLLVLDPLAGMAVGGLVGTGFGALSGSMADYGINDQFIKNLVKTIQGLLGTQRSTPDKVLRKSSRSSLGSSRHSSRMSKGAASRRSALPRPAGAPVRGRLRRDGVGWVFWVWLID
jgi:uncharacterized membrane protein